MEEKIDRFETTDRYDEIKSDETQKIQEGLHECLTKNDLSLVLQKYSPYIYVFAHVRTEGNKKRLLWQPRLTKPEAADNSYLFRVESNTENCEICWILPPMRMWEEFTKKGLFDDEIISYSIASYKNKTLNREHPDDLPPERIKNIYKLVDDHFRMHKLGKKLILPKNINVPRLG